MGICNKFVKNKVDINSTLCYNEFCNKFVTNVWEGT